jgi:transcriptional regulator with XRE-family HTH domain
LTKSQIREKIPNMETSEDLSADVDARLAVRLKGLRQARGWTLDDLAARSGVSRATLSRLENAETSPTAAVLGKLCTAFGLTLSRLMMMVEEAAAPLVRLADQVVWRDPAQGFTRRIVSPPGQGLSGEAVEVVLEPATHITYEAPPRPGLEHHLVLLEGALTVSVEARVHALSPGDCLRYRLNGPSRFETTTGQGARYLIFLV